MPFPINLQYTTIKTPLPNFIYEGLKTHTEKSNVYHHQPENLINKLSQKSNIPSNHFYLTAGIDEAIHLLTLVYGEQVTAFTPTYIGYKFSEKLKRKPKFIWSIKNNVYSIPIKEYPESSLIFVANPNNPCGNTSKKDIVKLIKINPKAIVVIDEAYSQYANLSIIDQIKKYSNLVVLRSFSKDYGMAGIRIGYIVAHPNIIKPIAEIAMACHWNSTSYISIGAAITALEHEDYFKSMRKDITQIRDDLIEFLKQQNFTVLPSLINAVLIKFSSKNEGTNFFNYLNQNNIFSSHGNGGSNIGLDKSFVRIAIGTKEQMSSLKKTISINKMF